MPTTNSVDYATQFIAMRPDDETRSVVELLDVEKNDGYSNMTDAEIRNLIAYKEHTAQNSVIIEQNKEHNDAVLKAMKETAEEQLQETRSFFQQALNTNPVLMSVTGNEVN